MDVIKIYDDSDKLFYIGGVVRDEILNKNSFDIDITYIGNALEYCRKFGEIIKENPEFKTVRIKVKKEFTSSNKEVIVDFASTRSETYDKKGHLPVIKQIGCSLKEDIMRRDFTINSLAKSVKTGEIIDYVNGLDDIKNKKLRVLHDESFVDDPTRIIRALKFSTRFDFELDEHTKELQEKYLANINRDMSYKRLKKELVETFNLNSQKAYEKFINENIYKLVVEHSIELPKINIENLINKYNVENVWIVYVGTLKDLSKLPLTKQEQKILDDLPNCILKSDLELYRHFENANIETVLLYAILFDEKGALRYLDYLRNIKLEITGNDLKNLIAPSKKYKEIFDEVLKAKFKNPDMTRQDELKIAQSML
ncbi:CCA tRNA nucleotidyltransferase [bacterium]|nr:CCA tRNA nucleotidyltransferase [bacterium]